MLSEDSILRRLPPGLEAKQVVLFDAIRHAAEFSWLAFIRLDAVLTWLVDADGSDPNRSNVINAAYMDAWSLVDAIDRFRALWAIVPRAEAANNNGGPTFTDLSQQVRKIRNVTDHLAQRIDYVASKGSPVMGLLTWVTFPQGTQEEVYSCALAAGTLKKADWELVNPAGRAFQFGPSERTALIHLAAGEYVAHLSELIPEMQLRIQQLEEGLEMAFNEHNLIGKQVGGDFFYAIKLSCVESSSCTATAEEKEA